MTSDLKIAVLTLTRDRLDYTRHCFAALEANAGCDYTHWVLDQGSQDGTHEWLDEWSGDERYVVFSPENIGISEGMNVLLDHAVDDDSDVIVKIDNDLELVTPNTLRDVAELTLEGGCLLSPRILGLKNPPQPTGELRIGDEVIVDVPQIGGIFLAAPGWWYDDYRYPDNLPPWGLDDVHICATFRQQGGTCGYVKRLEAWHYETTVGQEARYPEYFERKAAEVAA